MQPAIRSGRQALPVTNHLFLSGSRLVLIALLTTLAACAPLQRAATVGKQAAPHQACDDSLKSAARLDADTTVLLVKSFAAGAPLTLGSAAPDPKTPTAAVATCLVKLLVGPGNPGPADSPATSPGIGIEVWLPDPARWNERIRAFGSGGWAGGSHALTTAIGSRPMYFEALAQGYAVSASDHGNPDSKTPGRGAGFTLQADGSPNTPVWRDFAERSLHEQAVKTKALVLACYGRAQKYAYWDGYSTGGRQGYKLAQRYPGDFNGILAGAPAFNWTRFITAELYPQVVMQRELGGPIAAAKLEAAGAAATRACGGDKLGFLIDPRTCRYDPSRDPAALCRGVKGNGRVAGAGTDPATCLKLNEAVAINRIWYGHTTDGKAPNPATDNGTGDRLASATHLWWGLTRGTQLVRLAGELPFAIASDMVAIELGKPSIAQPTFKTAAGNGADGWKQLSYAQLAKAQAQGISLQSALGDINTDDTNLAGAREAGTKIVSYHGWADDLIMPQGSIQYYTRLAAAMGGDEAVQQFNRLYMIPALAHDSTFKRTASLDPATGAPTLVNKVPLPESLTGRDHLFKALRDWVENGKAPDRIDLSSADGSVSMPICVFPKIARYDGSGPVGSATSYRCN